MRTIPDTHPFAATRQVCSVALPLFVSDLYAHTDKVGTPEAIGANWELDGAKNAERWWFV